MRELRCYLLVAILISALADPFISISQEKPLVGQTERTGDRDRSLVFTDNNLLGPSTSSLFALDGQRLVFRGTARTGGKGNGGGDYYGLDQVAMFQGSADNCGFVTDVGTSDISAFKVRSHELSREISHGQPLILPPWHRYTDPNGRGSGSGIGLAISGKYLFAAYSDSQNIGVWEIRSGCTLKLLGTYNAAGPIAGVRAAPDGKTPEGRTFRNCTHSADGGSLYLYSICHPQSPTWAVLSGDTLTIECAECHEAVVRFLVHDAITEY